MLTKSVEYLKVFPQNCNVKQDTVSEPQIKCET